MIVKPSISFLKKDSDAKLITSTNGIVTGITGNPGYSTPVPTIPAVSEALEEFSTAVSDAASGGKTLTSIKNDKRAALVALLRQLASYVLVTCNGDMTVLLSSGFPVQKPQRQSFGVLPAPSNLTVTLGARTGELRAIVSPVAGASIYNWRLSTAAAPTVIVQSAQTTATTNVFANLTPGVVYVTVANVVGAAGPSNWSEPVPQMAT